MERQGGYIGLGYPVVHGIQLRQEYVMSGWMSRFGVYWNSSVLLVCFKAFMSKQEYETRRVGEYRCAVCVCAYECMCVHVCVCVHRRVRWYLLRPIAKINVVAGPWSVHFLHRSEIKDRGWLRGLFVGAYCDVLYLVLFCFVLSTAMVHRRKKNCIQIQADRKARTKNREKKENEREQKRKRTTNPRMQIKTDI